MTARGPLQISAVLVVHNEESFVGHCLESLAAVADEVLVAHDGPCSDRSLEIARQYTPHVFVHEFRGAPETHVIQLIRKANHDWILRLDCDETLSPGLIQRLREIKSNAHLDEDMAQGLASGQSLENVTHYDVIWRAIYTKADESPARALEIPNRTVLFQRSAATWVGIPHNLPHFAGAARAIRECIYHYAPHQHYGLYKLLTKKLYPFSKNDASIRIKFPIEALGADSVRPVDRWRNSHPLLVAGPLAAYQFARALLTWFRSAHGEESVRNLRWPIAHGAYQLFLAYHIYRLRRHGSIEN